MSMKNTIIIVSLAHPAGYGNYQPSELVMGSGETFDDALDDIRSRVAAGVRFDDAKTLEVELQDGTVALRRARGKMRRYGKEAGVLVCPECGSEEIRQARQDPAFLTCEQSCYGSSGSPRWMFEGHYDPDGDGPPDRDESGQS